MKRRSFLGALAALVAAPKALLALGPKPIPPTTIVAFDTTPFTELQVWCGRTFVTHAIWKARLTPDQKAGVGDYMRKKYGVPLDGTHLQLRWFEGLRLPHTDLASVNSHILV